MYPNALLWTPLTLERYLEQLDHEISSDLYDHVVAYYESELLDGFDWGEILSDALDNPTEDQWGDSENPCGTCYLGDVFSLTPSGKYYQPYACSNVSENEAKLDELWFEALDNIAKMFDGWIESGEGDPCDLFFCINIPD